MTDAALHDVTLPDDRAAAAAAAAVEELVEFLRAHPAPATRVALVAEDAQDRAEVVVPTQVLRLVIDLLDHLARGDAVTVAPVHAELTTQQAADLLNVSRPHLIKLLQQDRLPFHMVGNRRKIRLTDVLAYRDRDRAARLAILDELAREAEELGLYDETGPFETVRGAD